MNGHNIRGETTVFVFVYTYILRGYMLNVYTVKEVQTHYNRGRKTIGHYFSKKKTIILREIKSIYIYKCMYICSLLLGIIGYICPQHCSNIIPNLSARDHIIYSDKIYVLGISTIIVI